MKLSKLVLLMALTCSWVTKEYSIMQKNMKAKVSYDLKSDDEQQEEEENEELAA